MIMVVFLFVGLSVAMRGGCDVRHTLAARRSALRAVPAHAAKNWDGDARARAPCAQR
jgi:hypothetical protein